MAHTPYTPSSPADEDNEVWANEALLRQSLEQIQADQNHLLQLHAVLESIRYLELGVNACESWSEREQRLFRYGMANINSALNEAVPSLESQIELTREVALEDLSGGLRRVWEAIVRTVKRIWDKIMSFFKARDMQAMYIRDRLKRQLFALEGLDGATIVAKTISVGSSYHFLGKRSGGPAGPRELLTALTEYEQFVSHIYGAYVGHLDHVGHNLGRALDSFNYADPIESAKVVNEAALPFSGETLYKAAGAVKPVNHSEYPGDVVHSSNALIGMRELLVVEKPHKEGESLEELTSVLTQTRVVLSLSNSVPTGATEIAPYTVSELKSALREVERLVSHLENHRQSRTVERLAGIQAHMMRVSEQIEKRTATHPLLVAKVLEYSSSYAVWCLHPIMEVTASIQQIATHVMALVNANLRAYRGLPGH